MIPPEPGAALAGSAAPDRGHLLTEQANPASASLDQLSSSELVDLFCREDEKALLAMEAAAPALAEAVEAISARLRSGGRLFYLGAGTSGRLGVLDAAECPPTFCTPPELVQGVLAGGAPALLRSSEGLEDLREAGRDDLIERGFTPADALVGIAAGGTTPYVLGGLEKPTRGDVLVHGRSLYHGPAAARARQCRARCRSRCSHPAAAPSTHAARMPTRAVPRRGLQCAS